MSYVKSGVKRAIQDLPNGGNPKHAAIFINVKDAERIKKGTRIKISAYGYVLHDLGKVMVCRRKNYL